MMPSLPFLDPWSSHDQVFHTPDLPRDLLLILETSDGNLIHPWWIMLYQNHMFEFPHATTPETLLKQIWSAISWEFSHAKSNLAKQGLTRSSSPFGRTLHPGIYKGTVQGSVWTNTLPLLYPLGNWRSIYCRKQAKPLFFPSGVSVTCLVSLCLYTFFHSLPLSPPIFLYLTSKPPILFKIFPFWISFQQSQLLKLPWDYTSLPLPT